MCVPLMPVNNSPQAGPSNNNNQALVVQADESCEWSIQLGSGDQGGTACYAEVVKDLKQACGGESSEDEDSSGYSGSSDEESSSSGEDDMDGVSRKTIDADVEKFLGEAKAVNDRRSILVDQAGYSHHSAFMANVGGSSCQVCVDKPKSDRCDSYNNATFEVKVKVKGRKDC
ncbi:hypothetical protein Hanom_Chr08g00742821 [Helianthus anomalus]